MNKDFLEGKLVDIKARFLDLQESTQSLKNQVESNTEELLRLNGEYRVTNAMLEQWIEPEILKKEKK